MQLGRGAALGGAAAWYIPVAVRRCGDRGVCRGKRRDARLRLAVARWYSDGDHVAVPAFQPVVHDAVAAVSSFDLRALGVRAWGWILAVGILLTLAGFICLMDPWVSVAAMGMTVGIVFLLEGVSSIVYACISRTKDI